MRVAVSTARVVFLKPALGTSSRNAVRDFLYGCWCDGRRIGGTQMPPLTELLAATAVRRDGVDSSFIDAQVDPDGLAALARGGLHDVLAVCVMSSTSSFRTDLAALRQLKAVRPDLTTVLYGSHPTFRAQDCLESDTVDYAVCGEPEDTLRELVDALARGLRPRDLAGTACRGDDGRVVVNRRRDFVEMDSLPIPDRSLLPRGVDYFNPLVRRVPYTTLLTSRGCPARCNFCTAPVFYGNTTRVRSAAAVLEEMRQLKRLGYRELFFRDETFTAYKGRNQKLFEGMARDHLDFTWIANGRVDMVDAEALRAMRGAGCHTLKFGVESGSPEMLLNYKKGATVEQAEEAFRRCKEAGIDTHAHIIFGGPGESEQTLRQTRELLRRIRPTTATFGILTPYPGTEIFERVAAVHPEIRDGSEATMEHLHVEGFFSEALCGIPRDELARQVVRAYRDFYLRPGYLIERILRIRTFEELLIKVIGGLNVLGFALHGRK